MLLRHTRKKDTQTATTTTTTEENEVNNNNKKSTSNIFRMSKKPVIPNQLLFAVDDLISFLLTLSRIKSNVSLNVRKNARSLI